MSVAMSGKHQRPGKTRNERAMKGHVSAVKSVDSRWVWEMRYSHRRTKCGMIMLVACAIISTFGMNCGCKQSAPQSSGPASPYVQEDFYDNGTLRSRVEVKAAPNGTEIPHGTAQYWDVSGVLVRQCHYVNGLKQGTEIRWYIEPAGAIADIVQYYGGIENGPCIGFDEHGSILHSGMMTDGKESGEWTYWYPLRGDDGGNIAARVHRGEAGRWEGHFVAWHWNGSKKEEGNCRDGQRVGTWRFWNEDGSLERTVEFGNGELISPRAR
jgi:antitoxin component YwqK of YwqJK toxin-antitoxin module